MESQESMEDLVARLDRQVDRIDGLITASASGERVVAVVDSRGSLPAVRKELLRLGVPDETLEVTVVGEVLIPYPMTDKRLERWFAEAEGAEHLDVGVTVREPKLKLTPRSVGKVVLFLLIGYSFVSALIFLTLTVWERLAG